MNCGDGQIVSSRTESRRVQFQGALKSASFNCSSVSDVMEENGKIDLPGQERSPKCGKIATEKADSIAEFKEELLATRTIIFEQQKRNAVLEEVVVNLCDQMRHVIDRLPASSVEEQATMHAQLKHSIAKLSEPARLESRATRVTRPSTQECVDETLPENVSSFESPTYPNQTLKNTEINSTLQANELGAKTLQEKKSSQSVQDNFDISQEEVQENPKEECIQESINGKGANTKDSQALVYHLSEKHGPSGSKTLRINIAPSREENHSHAKRLTKSAFSSSFSTLPNVTPAKLERKSKTKYERTNSLQSLNSSVSFDDLDWPDTDKLLEELDVIKEKSLSNLALEFNERKLSGENSVGPEAQRDSANQPQHTGCPDGSGHCDVGGDSKSSPIKDQPAHLKSGRNVEFHGDLRKPCGTNEVMNSSTEPLTISQTSNCRNTNDICDGPHGCSSVDKVTAAEYDEKSVSTDTANVLQCAPEKSQSQTISQKSQEGVVQPHSKAASNTQKTSKSSSKRRRRKRLSESESACKSSDETKDLDSQHTSVANEFSNSPNKTNIGLPRSDVLITTSRRKSKNKHLSSNTSSVNSAGDNTTQNETAKTDATSNIDLSPNESIAINSLDERVDFGAEVSETNSTPCKVSNIIPSVDKEPYFLPPAIETETNDALSASKPSNHEHLPEQSPNITTYLGNSLESSTLMPEALHSLSSVSEDNAGTDLSTGLSPMMDAGRDPAPVRNVATSSPSVMDVSSEMSSVSNAIIEPSSMEGSVMTVETSTQALGSVVLSHLEVCGQPFASDMNMTISPTPDVPTSGPSLTEVAGGASQSKEGVDAKCSKVSDTCQLSSSESPGLDQQHASSGPSSHFSPEAKEFEPTREYGKAKLLLSPEVSKDAKNKTRCPKLTSSSMEQDNYSPPSEDKQGTCAECGASTTQRCSNCRQVFYCKRECQREQWKRGHKNDCKPFKLETNSTLGRYLVATRDFKAGDIIFKDDPLFIGPKQITEPICLGCYKRVNGSYRCSKCTWPMCGPVCESSPDHQPECVVGKVMGSPIDIQDFNDSNHFYEVVSPLRGLALKKKAPKKYEELISLESHFSDRVGTHAYNENQKRVVNMLKNYFMLVDFPSEDIDASDRSIHEMTGIIDVNTVEIPLEETEIIGIYPTYSMLEHSCTPNTKYKVSPLHQLTLRAAVNIRQGEHLSTIYTHILWGTAARRDCLKSTRYFMCTCRRCADPTELGTNFSALRCPKCPLGFMMSAAPLDQLADWICTSCNSTMTADEANEITLQLGEEVETVLANGRVKDLEDFIERSSATVVHPNHFHLFAARHSLLQMLGREKSGLDEEAVKKKEKLCQEFLKTCTALDPGMCKLSSYAGVALYEYHLAVMARTRQGPTDQQVDKIALKKDLDTAKALLQQCIKVLQEEPSEKPEGQLRNLAEQNLQELSQWESP